MSALVRCRLNAECQRDGKLHLAGIAVNPNSLAAPLISGRARLATGCCSAQMDQMLFLVVGRRRHWGGRLGRRGLRCSGLR